MIIAKSLSIHKIWQLKTFLKFSFDINHLRPHFCLLSQSERNYYPRNVTFFSTRHVFKLFWSTKILLHRQRFVRYIGNASAHLSVHRANDYTVTEIQDHSFFCNHLTSIILPSHLINIRKHSFLFSQELTEITFPEGLIDIGRFSFHKGSHLFPTSLINISLRVFHESPLLSL